MIIGTTEAVEFRRGDSYVYRYTVGEHLLVALHARGDEPLYALTPTGALLWDSLAEWRTVEQLGDALASEYDVTREQAILDARDFLEQLTQLQAVQTRGVTV
jgi:hypothetical protein